VADQSNLAGINNDISVTSADISLQNGKIEQKKADSIDFGHIPQ